MARFGRAYPITRRPMSPHVVGVPTYDNSALSGHQLGIPSGTPFTWSQTVGVGGPYGIVPVYTGNASNTTNLSATAVVTFGGVTLSSLGNVYLNNVSGNGFIWVFGGNNIPSGSQTVSVTITQGGTIFGGDAASYTYRNVSSVGALQTAFGNSASPSLSVPSGSGSLVWGSIADTFPSSSLSAFSLTQRQTRSGSSPTFIAGDTAGASTVTVSETINTPDTWAAVGLTMLP